MWLGRFIIHFFKPLIWLLFPFKVVGKENIPTEETGEPVVLCSNHISDIDPIFLEMAQPRHVYFMAKDELFRSALTRWLFGKQLGAFPVKRGAGDVGALDTARNLVNSGKMLGIFPEGTRSRDGKLGRAKSGASLIVAQTGAVLLPVCIATKGQHLRLFQRTTITFGKAMTPQELHLEDEQHPDLRYASRLLMGEIGRMMEESS